MSDLMKHENGGLWPVVPRVDFTTRVATMEDFGWMDAMQKRESDKLGFLMKAAWEKRIARGDVLVAEATGNDEIRMTNDETAAEQTEHNSDPIRHSSFGFRHFGYCMAVDKYMRQDHVGHIYQLNVIPEMRRSLVGASLVQATFDKSAYGTRLYGLWCRQDLEANEFWESLGFVPLAFRAAGMSKQKKGSGKGPRGQGAEGSKQGAEGLGTEGPSGRAGLDGFHSAPLPLDPLAPSDKIHIYWQKRVRVGDEGPASGGTAYWYPYETQGGLMGASRVALPIPPGTTWREAKPVVLPGVGRRAEAARLLEAEGAEKIDEAAAGLKEKRKEARVKRKEAEEVLEGPKVVHGVVAPRATGGPVGFGKPAEVAAAEAVGRAAAAVEAEKARVKEEKRAAKRRVKAEQRKSDPEVLAFSRELRDRWQEAVAAEPGLLGLGCSGKYGVGRLVEATGLPGCGGGEAEREVIEVEAVEVRRVKRLGVAA